MLVSDRGVINERIYLSFAGFFPGFVVSGQKTALVDTGVPPIGPELYRAIRVAIGDRPLDYVFLTHSHYDHCGSIPYLKRKYPALKVAGSAIAKRVLSKAEARVFMQKLSDEVEEGMDFRANYPDEDISLDTDLLDVDIVVSEGDSLDLGDGVKFDVLETPGHTRCSVSYYMPKDRVIFAGESVGAYSGKYGVLANFLSDYTSYVESLKKVSALPIDMIGLPHHGMLMGREDVVQYLENAVRGALEFRKLAEDFTAAGMDENAMVKELIRRYYKGPAGLQPIGAFTVNLKAMINAVKNLNR